MVNGVFYIVDDTVRVRFTNRDGARESFEYVIDGDEARLSSN